MDIAFTIDDPDAIDRIKFVIDANGLGESPSDIIAGKIIPILIAEQGQQLVNAAQAAAANDPAVLAFQQRQAAKLDPPVQTMPPVRLPPQ